jgi:CheY-like chemotaxis protein
MTNAIDTTVMAKPEFLVVDDNDLDFEKISRSFSQLKISNPLRRARDGIEALEILHNAAAEGHKSSHFIVLLDLNMPRMGGLELLAKLRDNPKLTHVSVFVLTTSDHPNDISRAHDFNVAGYIVKPVKKDQMLEALTALNHFWTLCEYPE